MSLKISKKKSVYHLKGEIDKPTIKNFLKYFIPKIKKKKKVVLNINKTNSIDKKGINAIFKLMNFARKREKNFHITGLVERKNMPYWLDQIDIAIQPAVTPWASPLKLIEYLGKGKAIVAPDTPNIKELLRWEDTSLRKSPISDRKSRNSRKNLREFKWSSIPIICR